MQVVSLIAQVASSGGEVAHVSAPSPTMSLLAVSPDGANLLVADEVGQTAFHGPLWACRCSAARLADWDNCWAGRCLVPDGQRIVYADGHDLFLAKSDGSDPHKLVTAPDQAYYPAWSPDGTEIRFNGGAVGAVSPTGRLYQVEVDGTNLLLSSPTGILPPRNVAASGLPTANISFFSQGQYLGSR